MIMASYDFGKPQIISWIKEHFSPGDRCLDVGACDGKWADLLGDYLTMDACEVWEPNIINHDLRGKYWDVYCENIRDLEYDYYDLVIFGDVIEHMKVEDAQKVLEYAKEHSRDIVVGVPWRYFQGELYGNPYEKHIQDDLTPELFEKRYKGLEVLCDTGHNYVYYHIKR